MRVILPNQIILPPIKNVSPPRLQQIMNSARRSSEWGEEQIRFFTSLIEEIEFFETIYKAFLCRNNSIPAYFIRFFLICLFIFLILSIVKALIPENFIFQMATNAIFIFLSVTLIIIILYAKKNISINTNSEEEMKNYLSKIQSIKSSIKMEIMKSDFERRKNPEKFMREINNDIENLSHIS